MKGFILNSQNADAWRSLLIDGTATPSLDACSSVTLPGALELFGTAVTLATSTDLLTEIKSLTHAEQPIWQALWSEWEATEMSKSTADLHGTHTFEFFRLRNHCDKTSPNFSLFLERFCRTMRREEFPGKFANALAKIVDEMADNVIQHSSRAAPFSGIAGYHVQEGRAAFSVVDLGRGILATLRDSPAWAHLDSARAALRAVVRDGASSREGQGGGEGFKQLFGSMVDHNCLIRLRTDDSILTVADGLTDREGGELASPQLPGVQVSISCAVARAAKEFAMTID